MLCFNILIFTTIPKLEGTPIAMGTVDPQDVPCFVTDAAPAMKVGVISVAAVEVVDVDLDQVDLSQVLPGEPIVVCAVDPDTVPGGVTTQALTVYSCYSRYLAGSALYAL